MRRLAVSLALAGLIMTACQRQPTPAPGEPTWTPKPTRTLRPTVTPVPPTATVTPYPTLTAFPTSHVPTPGAYTFYDLPTEQVCQRSVRERTIEETYVYAFVPLDALRSRLEANPEWLTERDFQRDLASLRREIERLEVPDCAVYGHGLLMLEVEALEAAFDLYRERPADALLALTNARSVSTAYFMWSVGNNPWRPVPLH